MHKYLFKALCTALTVYFTVFTAPVCASEEALMAEINMLKAKVAEMEELKIQIAELQKQVGGKCSMLEVQGTVQDIKESLIQYKPGEGMEIAPCGFKIQADATFVLQGTPNAKNAATIVTLLAMITAKRKTTNVTNFILGSRDCRNPSLEAYSSDNTDSFKKDRALVTERSIKLCFFLRSVNLFSL